MQSQKPKIGYSTKVGRHIPNSNVQIYAIGLFHNIKIDTNILELYTNHQIVFKL